MASGPPEKVRLISDRWHIRNVGRLKDGRLFVVDVQLAVLGDDEITDIWIRPFETESHDTVFGFIPVPPEAFAHAADDGFDPEEHGRRVAFMPGNTLSFHPPWDEGGYDT